MKKKIVGIFVCMLFLGINLFSIGISDDSTFSDTIIVPDDYPTIQKAIDNASRGDTIFVKSGVYNENIIIDKSINLIGENKETTIIDANGISNVVNISNDGVNITGFIIQNSGSDSTDAGIYVNSNNSMILGNIIYNNFFGIYQFQSTYNTISENNVTYNNNCGIVLADSSSTIISDNFITGQPFNGIGLSQGSKNNIISRNVIQNNNYSGFRIIGSKDNSILDNNLINNEVGVRLEYSSNNIITDNNFLENRQRIALFFGENISHCSNTWDGNYWGRSKTLPKIIFGRLIFFPWINVDLNPVKEPYESDFNPIAVIDTSMGTMTLELFKDEMPITTDNFIRLADDDFFNNLVFHRVIDDFVIQGGGYYANGTHKTSPYGSIILETSPDVKHIDGAISMARTSNPNSATSQFFICDGAQSHLDGNYAAFGVIINGIDVLRDIAAVQTTTKHGLEDWPINEIIINSISIVN